MFDRVWPRLPALAALPFAALAAPACGARSDLVLQGSTEGDAGTVAGPDAAAGPTADAAAPGAPTEGGTRPPDASTPGDADAAATGVGAIEIYNTAVGSPPPPAPFSELYAVCRATPRGRREPRPWLPVGAQLRRPRLPRSGLGDELRRGTRGLIPVSQADQPLQPSRTPATPVVARLLVALVCADLLGCGGTLARDADAGPGSSTTDAGADAGRDPRCPAAFVATMCTDVCAPVGLVCQYPMMGDALICMQLTDGGPPRWVCGA